MSGIENGKMTPEEQEALVDDLRKKIIDPELMNETQVAAAIGCKEGAVRGWLKKGGHVSLGYQDRLKRLIKMHG